MNAGDAEFAAEGLRMLTEFMGTARAQEAFTAGAAAAVSSAMLTHTGDASVAMYGCGFYTAA